MVFEKPLTASEKVSLVAPMLSQIAAFVIDFALMIPLRLATLLWFWHFGRFAKNKTIKMIDEMYGGVDKLSLGVNQEAIATILKSDFVKVAIVAMASCAILGMIYRLVFLMSSWNGTLGQYFVGIRVVPTGDANDCRERLMFTEATSRVLMLYLGLLWPTLIIPVAVFVKSNSLIITLLVLTSVWGDVSFIFGTKLSIPDMISGTVAIRYKRVATEKLSFFKKR